MRRLLVRGSLFVVIYPLLLLVFSILPTANNQLLTIYAQSQGIEVTSVFDIADQEAEDGDILIATEDGIKRTNFTSDNRMFGVLQKSPVVVQRRFDNTGEPVLRAGTAIVNVTTINGNISRGDFITTSEIPGKGQKTTQSGYVLGVALEPLTDRGGQKINVGGQEVTLGKIPVALRVEYAEITTPRSALRLFELIGAAFFKNIRDPEKFGQTVRYLVAGAIILSSFAFAFITLSRTLPKGIEAIGRNPLARNSIQLSIALNAGMIIGVILIGFVAALVVLRI